MKSHFLELLYIKVILYLLNQINGFDKIYKDGKSVVSLLSHHLTIIMKGMERNMEESLCEKSMKVVSNVIKMSAFSIAKRSLRSTVTNHDPRAAHPMPLISMIKPLMRAEQPRANTKQTYLVGPEGVNAESSSSFSSLEHVVKEDMNVDGRASDYIRKFRKKNQIIGSENSSSKFVRSRAIQ